MGNHFLACQAEGHREKGLEGTILGVFLTIDPFARTEILWIGWDGIPMALSQGLNGPVVHLTIG